MPAVYGLGVKDGRSPLRQERARSVVSRSDRAVCIRAGRISHVGGCRIRCRAARWFLHRLELGKVAGNARGNAGSNVKCCVPPPICLGAFTVSASAVSCVSATLGDMLASTLRRALNNRLQFPGWEEFGGLLVRHQEPGTGFIQLGHGSDTPMRAHARKVCQILHATVKNMIAVR